MMVQMVTLVALRKAQRRRSSKLYFGLCAICCFVCVSIFGTIQSQQDAKLANEIAKSIIALSGSSSTTNENASNNTIGKQRSSSACQAATLVLFGVPKEFNLIWNAYLQNIVRRNPHIQFDAHMHMYSDLVSFTNHKNKERNVVTESPLEIQHILNQTTTSDTNLLSTRLVTTSQEEYDKVELSWIQPEDTESFDRCCWTVDTLKNMFRQGNSIQQAYLSASSSSQQQRQKSPTNNSDRLFLFIRSDTLLISPIDLPCSSGLLINPSTLHLPSWQVNGHADEYNDRMALAGDLAADRYASAKSHAFREMILDRRRRVQNSKLPWASREKVGDLHNSEKMLKTYLDHESEDGAVVVTERELEWAQLVRVRAGNIFNGRDVRSFRGWWAWWVNWLVSSNAWRRFSANGRYRPFE